MKNYDEKTLINEIVALLKNDDYSSAYNLAQPYYPKYRNNAHFIHLLGLCAYKTKNIEQARDLLEKSIILNPKAPMYEKNISDFYRSQGMVRHAYLSAQRASILQPEDPEIWFNCAMIAIENRDIEEALEYTEKALKLNPDYPEAHFAKAEALLLKGEYEKGFEEYEWRFKIKHAVNALPKLKWPVWEGQQLKPNQLLIVTDQGFGDAIQFSRFIASIKEIAPYPLIFCTSELVSILHQIDDLGPIFSQFKELNTVTHYIPLTGLMHITKATLSTLPAPTAFRPDSLYLDKWSNLLQPFKDGKKNVCITWAGRATHKNDYKRSTSLKEFKPILDSDCNIFSIQKGESQKDLADYFGKSNIINLSPKIDNFDDTMAILHLTGNLVSVDTSVVHLAASLGINTHVAIPFSPDWRWGLDSQYTPWYPKNTKIYRQNKPHDWSGVFEEIANNLQN